MSLKTRQIPLLDLKAQHAGLRDEILAEVIRVIDSQKFILGEDVAVLEREIAAYTNTKFGVACASGSDALFLSLLALEIGPGDEVLTTPFTFFATAGAIVRAGAKPIFVDIEPHTFNLDPEQVTRALQAHPGIRAVIPVHLFGGSADMDPILAAVAGSNIAVIEDAAQAIGAEYRGIRCGTIGHLACFSFFPSKNLGAYGDGGMLTTNDESLAERLRALRVHGAKKKYVHQWVGVNSRLDALQAAVLRVKFRHLDDWTEKRRRNAMTYDRLLQGSDVLPPPVAAFQTRHIFNQYVIRCQNRDRLKTYLQENGVGTEVYYPIPLHLQQCFANLGYKDGDFPVSERAALEVLALPLAEVSADDIEYVCDVIRSFYDASRGAAQ